MKPCVSGRCRPVERDHLGDGVAGDQLGARQFQCRPGAIITALGEWKKHSGELFVLAHPMHASPKTVGWENPFLATLLVIHLLRKDSSER